MPFFSVEIVVNPFNVLVEAEDEEHAKDLALRANFPVPEGEDMRNVTVETLDTNDFGVLVWERENVASEVYENDDGEAVIGRRPGA